MVPESRALRRRWSETFKKYVVAAANQHATPLVDDLEEWLDGQLTQISGKSALAGAIRHGLPRLKRLRPISTMDV